MRSIFSHRYAPYPDSWTTANEAAFSGQTLATQCLEVGADLDFDAMVTECASLDALRQRFGRLNRDGRPIHAQGVIVIRADQVRDKNQIEKVEENDEVVDPVYGNALSRTWNWLTGAAEDEIVDFGIESFARTMQSLSEDQLEQVSASSGQAPVLLPAHLDRLAQTSPTPKPDPDVSLFLHGPQRAVPETQVCWRADIALPNEDVPDTDQTQLQQLAEWTQIVSLCPPTSAECMPVPLHVVRRWMMEESDTIDEDADIPSILPDERDTRDWVSRNRRALAWRGSTNSRLILRPNEIRPGDTLVLPISAGGWSHFGHVTDAPPDPSVTKMDVSKKTCSHSSRRSTAQSKRSCKRAIVRLHRVFRGRWPDSEAVRNLFEHAGDSDDDRSISEVREMIIAATAAVPDSEVPSSLCVKTLSYFGKKSYGLRTDRYPDNQAVVLQTRRRLGLQRNLLSLDDGDDTLSKIDRDEAVPLAEHLNQVRKKVRQLSVHLRLDDYRAALTSAAEMHDWGKADERFQALMLQSDVAEVWRQPTLWAKSARMPATRQEYERALRRSGLPRGFRHEVLSGILAHISHDLPNDEERRDLILHLIATHHGRRRPFPPSVVDTEVPQVDLSTIWQGLRLESSQRRSLSRGTAAHCANRYWRVIHIYGWWGTCFLETVLRLADQQASAEEDRNDIRPAEAAKRRSVGAT